MTGAYVGLTVEPSATISTIKDKIQDREGIPPNELILIFMQRRLDDERTVQHYKIGNGSAIYARIDISCGSCSPQHNTDSNPSTVTIVKTFSGSEIRLSLVDDDRVERVQTMIEERGGLPATCQRLLLLNYDGPAQRRLYIGESMSNALYHVGKGGYVQETLRKNYQCEKCEQLDREGSRR